MAEPILNRPRIMAGIGQGIAAAVAQHMRVNRNRQRSTLANALDLPVDGVGGEWSAALGREDEGAIGELPA
jgi:hypothetical protein